MSEENFWITNHFGEKLEALLRKPEGSGKFPAVLFVSGFGMDLHEYKNSHDEIAQTLVKNGFMTLQFSFAGRGTSAGNYLEMTLQRQAVQIDDVISWLSKTINSEDNRKIGLHATSFGVPSTMCAQLAKITSLCFVSGAYYPGKSMRQVFIEERHVVVEPGKNVVIPRSDG